MRNHVSLESDFHIARVFFNLWNRVAIREIRAFETTDDADKDLVAWGDHCRLLTRLHREIKVEVASAYHITEGCLEFLLERGANRESYMYEAAGGADKWRRYYRDNK